MYKYIISAKISDQIVIHKNIVTNNDIQCHNNIYSNALKLTMVLILSFTMALAIILSVAQMKMFDVSNKGLI